MINIILFFKFLYSPSQVFYGQFLRISHETDYYYRND